VKTGDSRGGLSLTYTLKGAGGKWGLEKTIKRVQWGGITLLSRPLAKKVAYEKITDFLDGLAL